MTLFFFFEAAVGLQNQLNILYRSSEKLQLEVNFDKSNITVFRKGGYLKNGFVERIEQKLLMHINI